jgi:hypothetical protein
MEISKSELVIVKDGCHPIRLSITAEQRKSIIEQGDNSKLKEFKRKKSRLWIDDTVDVSNDIAMLGKSVYCVTII